MAATKKALEIQAEKAQVAKEITSIRHAIFRACSRIPEWLATADATKSVEWRDFAEREFVRVESFPLVSEKGNSLNKLRDILARDLCAFTFIRHGSSIHKAATETAND